MKNNIYYSIIFSILLSACGGKPEKTAEEEKAGNSNIVTLSNEVLKNANISLVPVTKGQGSNIHKASGMVEVPPQNYQTPKRDCFDGWLLYSTFL
jgi:cobalt-zinc-cadmium efflux system membrane fusion protein